LEGAKQSAVCGGDFSYVVGELVGDPKMAFAIVDNRFGPTGAIGRYHRPCRHLRRRPGLGRSCYCYRKHEQHAQKCLHQKISFHCQSPLGPVRLSLEAVETWTLNLVEHFETEQHYFAPAAATVGLAPP